MTKRTRTPRRATLRITDDDGAAIVLVELPKRQTAKVLAEDWDRLLGLGVSPNWFLNGNGKGTSYVRTRLPEDLGWGNLAQVSRLIVCPWRPGVMVKHRDGDLLNLRRDNLEEVEGRCRAKGREARCVAPDEFARAA